eukprot:TRINITY_DN6707_c0_g2_i3.p2 TRINITY_DN6707_c0_g2~~TRINITY_DN6707_c0_g2_i3.p2  ORF type:complete len:137 (-),score=21.68 TRINITY_DN6707_c0_g2_i3:116-526(-)
MKLRMQIDLLNIAKKEMNERVLELEERVAILIEEKALLEERLNFSTLQWNEEKKLYTAEIKLKNTLIDHNKGHCSFIKTNERNYAIERNLNQKLAKANQRLEDQILELTEELKEKTRQLNSAINTIDCNSNSNASK